MACRSRVLRSAEKLERCNIRVTAADTWEVDDDGAARIVPFGKEMDIVATQLIEGTRQMSLSREANSLEVGRPDVFCVWSLCKD